MSNTPRDPDDLPRLPPGLVMAADIIGPWRVRARLVLMLLGYCLHLLNPLCAGGRLFILARSCPAPDRQPELEEFGA